jgi:mono/diheme cytochrome c family protein
MDEGGTARIAPTAHAAQIFETECAPCHGPEGRGGYVGTNAHASAIAGRGVDDIVAQARHGGGQMPSFSQATLDDGSLSELATYVHETLGHPERLEGSPIGPRSLTPFAMGGVVWAALAGLCVAMALLFGPGRN